MRDRTQRCEPACPLLLWRDVCYLFICTCCVYRSEGHLSSCVKQGNLSGQVLDAWTRRNETCIAGEGGRRIRELTSVVQKRWDFQENQVELFAEKVMNRGLCAVAQAESLRYKLLGGLAVRRCGSCHTQIELSCACV